MSETLTVPITHYRSSKGLVSIADMPYPHLANAVAKLQRDNDLSRHDEYVAMSAELARRPPPEALGADAPRNHNNPPPDEPEPVSGQSWPAIKADLDDNLTEARNWSDGQPLSTQAQADEVARLIESLRKGADLADTARKAERDPHDTVIDEIQARYNAYIAPTKNKGVKGKVSLALESLKDCQTAWLVKLEQAQKAEAKRLADEAQAKLDAAADAIRASAGNIEAREQAEELFVEAKQAERVAVTAGNAKAHAFGETRNIGLRDHFVASIADGLIACRWVFVNYRPELEALALKLAQTEVNNGARKLDGFAITNDRRV